MIKRSEPVFAVKDLGETLAFYRDVLGGVDEWTYGEPADFGGIRLGGAQLKFGLQPELAERVAGHEHFIYCDPIDGVYKQHRAAGARIVQELKSQPWGMREYVVEDPNGYQLRFVTFSAFEPSAEKAGPMPERYAVERRLAAWSEYEVLHESVGWGPSGFSAEGLAASCAGVVAIDSESDGRAVGMARAVRDAGKWYSIWDVVVLPEHQGRRVGESMMQALLEELRADAPAGAQVILLTHQQRFYEKLGFAEGGCMQLRL